MNNPNSPNPQNVNYVYPLPTSTLAIISLIAGLLGFGMPIIASIIAIITGYLAWQETRAVPPRATGDGMATAGIIMGGIQIALGILAICCYLVFVLGLLGSMGLGSNH